MPREDIELAPDTAPPLINLSLIGLLGLCNRLRAAEVELCRPLYRSYCFSRF